MAEVKQKLLTEFPPVSTEEWIAKITKDLKGVPFEKKLVWRTAEGFDLPPFFRKEDIEGLAMTANLPDEYPYVRSTRMHNEWLIRQDIVVDDPVVANKKALDLLGKGVTSLGFRLKKTHINNSGLTALLKDIVPDAVELNFNACVSVAAELTRAIAAYITKNSANPANCSGSIGYNPFKKQLVRGLPAGNWVETAKTMFEAAKPIPGYRLFAIDAHLLSDAGAYITQELGYALAWGQTFLATFTEHGYGIPEICSRLQFNFGIGTNYFMEIAKFRAARWLWAEIVGAYGKEYCNETAKIYQHAITSTWNKTIYDAHVNLLRTQTESMSAALGGVNVLTALPFDVAYQSPDDFSERIARNQQLLLKEECHFDKVVDPAAGSYYIESVTDSVADVAWKLFLAMESEGGFLSAIDEGRVQKAVNQTNTKRREAVARRREVLLGTNQFPNFTESATSKLHPESEHHHDCGCGNPVIEALEFKRAASDFEELRFSTERHGKTPVVFMLTIGNLAMRLARSQFSANFFACAGYKIIDNLGFKTVEEGIDAAVAAQADIVCICSDDNEYAEYAVAAYEKLDGRALFVVAGDPACRSDLETVGIKNYINVRSNVLETLRGFNHELGINAK